MPPERSDDMRTSPTAPRNTIEPTTLIWTGSALRWIEYTQIGNVLAVPDTKLVTTKSSMDRLNASSAAAMIPGRISGNVTFQNVVSSSAPRSIAASSSRRSNPDSRALTVTTTNEMQNMMWEMTIVWTPVG